MGDKYGHIIYIYIYIYILFILLATNNYKNECPLTLMLNYIYIAPKYVATYTTINPTSHTF
jgi:hypothetical protein